MSVNARLATLIGEVLGEKPGALTLESSASTLSRWDSLGHVKLMLKLESALSVKFTPKELMTLKSVGALQAALQARGALG